MAARAGGGGALTPVIKRRAILRGGDRTPLDHDASLESEAAAAAASALLAVRSSEGPKRWVYFCLLLCVAFYSRSNWYSFLVLFLLVVGVCTFGCFKKKCWKFLIVVAWAYR